MKIAFLAGGSSIHTIRWVNSLTDRGYSVYLLTLHDTEDQIDPRVKKIILPIKPPLGYYLNTSFLKYHLAKIKPEILHAHYASGYGTLGRLSGFSPYILSVWGSDIYDFPQVSTRNHRLIKKNLQSASMICSTSHAMARVTKKITPHLPQISITPFGVDTNIFSPSNTSNDSEKITIGTIKSLKNKYGIDILIRAFADARKAIQRTHPELAQKMRLLIVGKGPDQHSLINLAKTEGISEITEFKGAVPYARVPKYLREIDIYAAFSRSKSESFGVAIIEASSCGLPVAVSNADGPSEVVVDNQTGLIVPMENVTESSQALQQLVTNQELREKFGIEGRKHVIDNYSWNKSVDIMEKVYSSVLVSARTR